MHGAFWSWTHSPAYMPHGKAVGPIVALNICFIFLYLTPFFFNSRTAQTYPINHPIQIHKWTIACEQVEEKPPAPFDGDSVTWLLISHWCLGWPHFMHILWNVATADAISCRAFIYKLMHVVEERERERFKVLTSVTLSLYYVVYFSPAVYLKYWTLSPSFSKHLGNFQAELGLLN